jgi:F-type H+-transporting ATPase subunit b
MSGRKPILAILCIVPLLCFMSSEEGTSSSGISDLLGKIINFVVLVGGLVFVLYKPLRRYLEKRSHEVQAMIAEAREARQSAEKKLEEARQRMESLEKEVIKMKEDAEREGLKEKERIRALAQKEAERVRLFAEQEISLFLNAGIQELKEYTAELAASLAETRIKEKITDEDQSALVDKSIEKLAELYEKSSTG